MDVVVFLILITICIMIVFGVDISRKRRRYLAQQRTQ